MIKWEERFYKAEDILIFFCDVRDETTATAKVKWPEIRKTDVLKERSNERPYSFSHDHAFPRRFSRLTVRIVNLNIVMLSSARGCHS